MSADYSMGRFHDTTKQATAQYLIGKKLSLFFVELGTERDPHGNHVTVK